MRAITFWSRLAQALRADRRVLLAVVAESSVHSPGTAGAKMFVDEHGERVGTIGGGVMELRVLELAQAWFKEREDPRAERVELRHEKRLDGEVGSAVQRSGMICAGRQTNLYSLLGPDDDLAAVEEVVAALQGGTGGLWRLDSMGRVSFGKSPLTPLYQGGHTAHDGSTVVGLSEASGRQRKQREFSAAVDKAGRGCSPLSKGELEGDSPQPTRTLHRDGDGWRFSESLLERRRLAILGGGHCGQALARVMAGIGWHVSVWETRPQVIADADLDGIAEVRRVNDFRDAAEAIDLPGLTPVVVMTTDVPNDVRALFGALSDDRGFPFVGAMGSAAKIEEIRRRLTDLGVTGEALAQMTAPVGLEVDSHTPPEIAVSVAAQLLQRRHEWLGTS